MSNLINVEITARGFGFTGLYNDIVPTRDEVKVDIDNQPMTPEGKIYLKGVVDNVRNWPKRVVGTETFVARDATGRKLGVVVFHSTKRK